MDFKVKAISKDKFDTWVTAMKNVKAPQKADSASAQQGQEIFNKSCIGCHAVTPANKMPDTARVAPNLTNFGDRSRVAGILPHTKDEVKNWIRNPETYKPGNKMAGKYPQMSEDQLNALADYLMGLKVQ
jgi:cytochrome c oxidase subunit 2